jgi:hypothetical protein
LDTVGFLPTIFLESECEKRLGNMPGWHVVTAVKPKYPKREPRLKDLGSRWTEKSDVRTRGVAGPPTREARDRLEAQDWKFSLNFNKPEISRNGYEFFNGDV